MTERAYKYRFYPTAEQENLLRRTMGCVRLVYNKALATKTEGWYERQERIDYKQTSSLLTSWKKTEDLDFLNEVSCVPLQQCLRHLQKAFANFWGKRAKYPRFKAKRHGGSAEFTKSAFRFANNSLWLAKCQEPLNIVWSRMLPNGCSPSTVTVKLEPSGRWFVSLLVDDPTIQPLPPTDRKIGIDVGISSLLTTSDGDKITNPKHFNRLYQKLKVAQKELSRKTKGSNNRYKARLEVAKIHAQIKDARTDFLHKLTSRLVRANSVIAIEDLAIRNMVKNHKLARSISDAAWGEMFRQLEYKCERMSINGIALNVQQVKFQEQQNDLAVENTQESLDRAINSISNIQRTVQNVAIGFDNISHYSQKLAETVKAIEDLSKQLVQQSMSISRVINRSQIEESSQNSIIDSSDTIFSLMQQLFEATAKVEPLFANIKTEVREKTIALDSGTQQLISGVGEFQAVRQKLDRVVALNNKMNTLIENIAKSVENQTQSSIFAQDSVRDVADIAERISEQSMSITQSFNQLVVLVQKL